MVLTLVEFEVLTGWEVLVQSLCSKWPLSSEETEHRNYVSSIRDLPAVDMGGYGFSARLPCSGHEPSVHLSPLPPTPSILRTERTPYPSSYFCPAPSPPEYICSYRSPFLMNSSFFSVAFNIIAL